MRVYHFSENPYPAAWEADKRSLRVTLPNRHFDPKIGADLINRYIDEWALCDELGLDIWVNEHHSTATCVTASTMGLAGSAFQSDREGKPLIHRTASIPDLVKAGVVFAGTPDQVFDQIKELYDYVGGFGHLLAMMHGGALSHEDTVKSLTLFSREVLPRLGELDASSDRHLQSFEQLRQIATS